MRFKASLVTPAIDADTTLEFTQNQIVFPKYLKKSSYVDSAIKNGVNYTLIPHIDIDIRNRYEIKIGNGLPIRLNINKKNERKLKWIHKLYLIQKDLIAWIAIIIATISLIVSIVK